MGNQASGIEAPAQSNEKTSAEASKPRDTTALPDSDAARTMSSKSSGLKRPSNGISSRASLLSSSRNEIKQRNLPRAARPDPYEIPDSPEQRVMKLRRPADQLRQFSPLRKQQKAPIAKSQAYKPLSQEQDATTSGQPANESPTCSRQAIELNGTSTSPHRSLRKQAMTNMMPAEESVGSARRNASPATALSSAKRFIGSTITGPVFQPEDVVDTEVDGENSAIAITQESPKRSSKHGRLRENDEAEGSVKRRKVSGAQASSRPNENAATQELSGQHEIEARLPSAEPQLSNARSRQGATSNSAVKRGKKPLKPINLQIREVFPPGAAAENEAGDDDSVDGKAVAPQMGKQVTKGVLEQEKNRVAAATPSIVAEQSTAAHKPTTRDVPDVPDADSGVNNSILLGQYPIIKKFLVYVQAAKEISENEEIDRDIAQMQKFCESFVVQLNELKARPEDAMLLEEPPEELETIRADVRMLCGKDKSRPVNQQSEVKSQSIYFCMLPVLVQVLLAMIECYQATDAHEAEEELSVTIPHLQSITAFMRTIVDLGEGAKLYNRPRTSLAIVKPMQDKVLAPMKKIEAKFSRYIRQHAEMQRQRAHNRAEALRREAEERAEEEAKEEKAKWAKVSQKWTQLHEERYTADEILKPPAKRRHLRQPSSEPEEDHNGQRFTRLEVFRPRVGPPHALVEKAKSQAWPHHAEEALMNGLQEWAGDVMVFERIFRRHCRRGGALNPYNVTEVVVMAALMKHDFEEMQEEMGGDLAWARRIPDWTRPHTVLEQLEEAGL